MTNPEELAAALANARFAPGTRVTKIKGSSWTGKVVGFYRTSLTPEGYAVESENEPGSVQIYPAAALRALAQEARDGDGSVPPCKTCAAETIGRVPLEPAEWISDASKDGDGSFPWPLCDQHSHMALVAWGNTHRTHSPEGSKLLAAYLQEKDQ